MKIACPVIVLSLVFGTASAQSPTVVAVPPEAPDIDPVLQAIEKVKTFLSDKTLTFDEYWVARKSAHIMGEEYQTWAESLKVVEYSDSNAEALIADSKLPTTPFPHIPYPEGISPQDSFNPYRMSRDKIAEMLDFISLGLQCFGKCDPLIASKLLENFSEPDTGYYLTHQFWIHALLYSSGCITEEQYLELAPDLAIKLLGELLADNEFFTDVTAERAAFLCFAGLTSWVPESVVKMALDTQLETGDWAGSKDLRTDHRAHHAALAMFMLANVWQEKQNQQEKATNTE